MYAQLHFSFTNNQQRLAEDGAITIIVKAAIAARVALSDGESLLTTGNGLLQPVEHLVTRLPVVLCMVRSYKCCLQHEQQRATAQRL
jgi:hypothetical protein